MSKKRTVTECLDDAFRSEVEKGYPQDSCGFLTTREVADMCGRSIATVRKHLWAEVERGDVEAFDDGASGAMGNTISWRLTEPPLLQEREKS